MDATKMNQTSEEAGAARVLTLSTLGARKEAMFAGLAALAVGDGPNPAAIVAVCAANGVCASQLHREVVGSGLTRSLALRAGTCGVVSQVCWWGATTIGFLTARG